MITVLTPMRQSTVATCLFVCLVTTPAFQAPTEQIDLDRNLAPIHLENAPTVSALSYVFDQARITGGYESVVGCGEKPPERLTVNGTNLRSILDAIAAADSTSRWSMIDGAVNFSPLDGTPKFLQTQISEYDSGDAPSLTVAASILLESSDVRDAESTFGFTTSNPVSLGMGLSPKKRASTPKAHPISVRMQGTTIQGVLNALVRSNGHGLWLYREWHCNDKSGYSVAFSK
jgi:hypothetical protein